MIVTTAGRTNEQMIELAKEVANHLHALYMERNKLSISLLKSIHQQDVLVIGKERYELFSSGSEIPFFFHPNSAVFRIKRLGNGGYDPFIAATNLVEGKSFLDCTLGLGADSIVASYIVKEKGLVAGIEANPIIAYLVSIGLKKWETNEILIKESMSRIKVLQGSAKTILQEKETSSVDCVYLDPMFKEEIVSEGLDGLKSQAVYWDLTEELIWEAKRVAKERVVLKDHFRSKRFEQFGFQPIKRKSAKFHYGIYIKK